MNNDTYKIFRQLEARSKRANPYTFYDKDDLIDEILKDEDEIESHKNIIEEIRHNLSRITLECCDKKTQEKLVNLFGILDKVDKDE